MFYTLIKILPNNYPIDLIKLISNYTCDCETHRCTFCDNYFTSCQLKRCTKCHSKSCGLNICPQFQTSYVITYTYSHKEIHCTRSCLNCQSPPFPENLLDEIDDI